MRKRIVLSLFLVSFTAMDGIGLENRLSEKDGRYCPEILGDGFYGDPSPMMKSSCGRF